jgi:hypothetical protein
MYRRVLGLVALLALVFAVGCSGKKKTEGPGKGTTPAAASTPEEAFKQFQQAAADNDMKTMMTLVTPDLADLMVGQVVVGTLFGLGFLEATGGEEGKTKAKAIRAILEKHGLKEDELKKLKLTSKDALKELVAKITDKEGLVAALQEEGKKNRKDDENTKKQEQAKREQALSAELKDVKTEGETASGTIVSMRKNILGKPQKKEGTIKFKKIGGNWRISEIPN